MFTPRPYKILDVKTYSEDIKVFKVKTQMNPAPGQFFQVSVLGRGECPLASCSYDKEYVDILVRKAGNVTSAMFDLKKGNTLFLRGPYGNGYHILDLVGKNLILVAGGTGMAPITSLIEYIEQNRSKFGKATIMFGFRDEGHILLKDRISRWRKNFNILVCLDKGKASAECEIGFVHDVMNRHKPDTHDTKAVLCGPEVMMNAVSNTLINLGLPSTDIYWNMERRMECAFGSCGRCFIQDVYVCRDGPVFRYDVIKPRLENEANA